MKRQFDPETTRYLLERYSAGLNHQSSEVALGLLNLGLTRSPTQIKKRHDILISRFWLCFEGNTVDNIDYELILSAFNESVSSQGKRGAAETKKNRMKSKTRAALLSQKGVEARQDNSALSKLFANHPTANFAISNGLDTEEHGFIGYDEWEGEVDGGGIDHWDEDEQNVLEVLAPDGHMSTVERLSGTLLATGLGGRLEPDSVTECGSGAQHTCTAVYSRHPEENPASAIHTLSLTSAQGECSAVTLGIVEEVVCAVTPLSPQEGYHEQPLSIISKSTSEDGDDENENENDASISPEAFPSIDNNATDTTEEAWSRVHIRFDDSLNIYRSTIRSTDLFPLHGEPHVKSTEPQDAAATVVRKSWLEEEDAAPSQDDSLVVENNANTTLRSSLDPHPQFCGTHIRFSAYPREGSADTESVLDLMPEKRIDRGPRFKDDWDVILPHKSAMCHAAECRLNSLNLTPARTLLQPMTHRSTHSSLRVSRQIVPSAEMSKWREEGPQQSFRASDWTHAAWAPRTVTSVDGDAIEEEIVTQTVTSDTAPDKSYTSVLDAFHEDSKATAIKDSNDAVHAVDTRPSSIEGIRSTTLLPHCAHTLPVAESTSLFSQDMTVEGTREARRGAMTCLSVGDIPNMPYYHSLVMGNAPASTVTRLMVHSKIAMSEAQAAQLLQLRLTDPLPQAVAQIFHVQWVSPYYHPVYGKFYKLSRTHPWALDVIRISMGRKGLDVSRLREDFELPVVSLKEHTIPSVSVSHIRSTDGDVNQESVSSSSSSYQHPLAALDDRETATTTETWSGEVLQLDADVIASLTSTRFSSSVDLNHTTVASGCMGVHSLVDSADSAVVTDVQHRSCDVLPHTDRVELISQHTAAQGLVSEATTVTRSTEAVSDAAGLKRIVSLSMDNSQQSLSTTAGHRLLTAGAVSAHQTNDSTIVEPQISSDYASAILPINASSASAMPQLVHNRIAAATPTESVARGGGVVPSAPSISYDAKVVSTLDPPSAVPSNFSLSTIPSMSRTADSRGACTSAVSTHKMPSADVLSVTSAAPATTADIAMAQADRTGIVSSVEPRLSDNQPTSTIMQTTAISDAMSAGPVGAVSMPFKTELITSSTPSAASTNQKATDVPERQQRDNMSSTGLIGDVLKGDNDSTDDGTWVLPVEHCTLKTYVDFYAKVGGNAALVKGRMTNDGFSDWTHVIDNLEVKIPSAAIAPKIAPKVDFRAMRGIALKKKISVGTRSQPTSHNSLFWGFEEGPLDVLSAEDAAILRARYTISTKPAPPRSTDAKVNVPVSNEQEVSTSGNKITKPLVLEEKQSNLLEIELGRLKRRVTPTHLYEVMVNADYSVLTIDHVTTLLKCIPSDQQIEAFLSISDTKFETALFTERLMLHIAKGAASFPVERVRANLTMMSNMLVVKAAKERLRDKLHNVLEVCSTVVDSQGRLQRLLRLVNSAVCTIRQLPHTSKLTLSDFLQMTKSVYRDPVSQTDCNELRDVLRYVLHKDADCCMHINLNVSDFRRASHVHVKTLGEEATELTQRYEQCVQFIKVREHEDIATRATSIKTVTGFVAKSSEDMKAITQLVPRVMAVSTILREYFELPVGGVMGFSAISADVVQFIEDVKDNVRHLQQEQRRIKTGGVDVNASSAILTDVAPEQTTICTASDAVVVAQQDAEVKAKEGLRELMKLIRPRPQGQAKQGLITRKEFGK